MADTPPPNAGAPASADVDSHPDRNDWFTTTPEPWAEIVRLDYGGDRTFASTVQSIVLDAEPAQRAAIEQRLIGVLGHHELTAAGRAFACRMLGLIGTSACVPAVAPLLGDDRTADAARLALDAIDDPAVNAAYRGAVKQLSSAPVRIGVIGSLAMRGDADAVETLTAIAVDGKEPPVVRAAAENAVERILAGRTHS